MNTDGDGCKFEEDGDRQDTWPTESSEPILHFIGRSFSTVAVCGKTYGNVFGVLGRWRVFRCNSLITYQLREMRNGFAF
jgi:hypothetical protein